jgi:MFS family permease
MAVVERRRWWQPVDAIAACPPHPSGGRAPSGPPNPAARICQRWTLVVVCLASALLLFNVTAPNVALPDAGASLRADFAALQWVLSSYALVLAGLLLAGGALADRYGRRRLFLLGLAVFGAGSVVCLVAPSAGALIAGRVVQGVGAAALFPAGLALLGAEFAGPARARAIGVWGASVAAAIALGPLLGGLLVEVWGWRALFGAAALLVVPTLVVGLRHLRESAAGVAYPVDWVGTSLLSAALFLAVLVLVRGNAWGWASAPVLGGAALVIVLLIGFWLAEHRIAEPLIAPALLHNPVFVGTTLVALAFAAAGFAPITYLTQYLLTAVGAGPVWAGLLVAPFAVATFVVSLAADRVAARIGTRATLAGGLLLGAAGLVLMVLLGPPSTVLRLLPGLVLFGAGAGLVNPTMTVAALAAVPPDRGGMASGVNNAARQFGIAAGIAGFGAAVQAAVTTGVADRLRAVGVVEPVARAAAQQAADGRLGAASGVPAAALTDAYRGAYGDALDLVLLLGVGIAVLGTLVVLVLIRTPPAPTVPCRHADLRGEGAEPPVPSDDGCTECQRTGTPYQELRICWTCGHVGCCDSSPGRHAAAHHGQAGHPLVRSFEPGEDWFWCYDDRRLFELPDAAPAPSRTR